MEYTEPKIHVTWRGGFYVEARELLRSKPVRDFIDKMVEDPVTLHKPGGTSAQPLCHCPCTKHYTPG